MLVVPVVVGAVVAGPTWRHAVLLVAWLAGYAAFSAAGLWLRSGRKARYLPPLRFHLVSAGLLGAVLVGTSPALLGWAPWYAVLLAVSLAGSARRADRSWLNDAVTVLAACLMTVVSVGLRGGPPTFPAPPGAGDRGAWVAAGLLASYFLGTVPYVKTLIRDRGDRRVLAVSIGWHALVTAGALSWLVRSVTTGAGVLVAVALLAVAAALLVRAVLVPRRRPWPTAKAIGLGEVAATVVVAGAVLVAVR